MNEMDSRASKLFDKSMAFLEGGIATSKASDSSMFSTSEYSNVTAHLFHHAIELFLKCAIVSSRQSLPKPEHDIFNLYKTYKALYTDKEFDISTPFTEAPQYVGFTEQEIEDHKSNFPMSMELQLRYSMGRRGEPYSLITEYETNYLESCKEQFLKLRCKILPCEES